MTDQTPPPADQPNPDPIDRSWLFVGAKVARVRRPIGSDQVYRCSIVEISGVEPGIGYRVRYYTDVIDWTTLSRTVEHRGVVYELRRLTDPAVIDYRSAELVNYLVQERWTNDDIRTLDHARQLLRQCETDIVQYRRYLDAIEQGEAVL